LFGATIAFDRFFAKILPVLSAAETPGNIEESIKIVNPEFIGFNS
jgi:hypothetical protein